MGAPENDSELRLCANCFFLLPKGATECPDCKAAVDDAARLSGSDSEIYPELARANLYRMRGEYRKAEDVCRAILRRHPNNATAAGLLGDICVEEDQLEDAVRWYELAIDSAPDSESDKRKLEVAHRRMKEREALSTAEQLGLPVTKPRAGLFALLALGFVIAVCVAAYLLGKSNSQDSAGRSGSRIDLPFEAGSSDPNANVNVPDPGKGDPDRPVASNPDVGSNALLVSLKPLTSNGSRITDAWQDPRTKVLYVSLDLQEGDNERLIVASIGHSALAHVPDAPRAKFRSRRSGKEEYFADLERAAVDAAEPKLLETDPTSFANAVLSNEFPAPQPTSSGSGPTESSGVGTGDSDVSSGGPQGSGQDGQPPHGG